MLSFELREACESDLELAYQLTKQAMRDYVEQTWGPWVDEPQRAMHQQKFSPATHRFILVGGQPVGLIAVDEKPDCVWLEKIYLTADMRGQGIGSALIADTIATAVQRAKPVQLRVLRVNDGARRLYERHGFSVIEVQPERLIMRRESGTANSVSVEPWTAEWAVTFDARSAELLGAFEGANVVVEHIGSTAVPGLAAKPVIDVLLGAATLAEIESRIDPLARLGYRYVPKYEAELPTRRYFVKSVDGELRVHLHAVELDSRIWREHLSFRDALRGDALLREQYQALKLQLAASFAHDKSAYTAAKGPFIQSVMAASLIRR
ncbi:MAG: GNAT family N-acetyltransferase [Ahniella sp.]|nr:GNAT family N-acetyltransferase [Ahniella sp.]